VHTRPHVALAATLILAGVVCNGGAALAQTTPAVPVTLLVGRAPGVSSDAIATAADSVADTTAAALPKLSTTAIEVSAADSATVAEHLRSTPGVTSVEVDQPARIDVMPDDPGFPAEWGDPLTHVPAAWDRTIGDPGTVIAVVDTGVNPVADLAGRVLPGIDLVNHDADPADDNGHGTNVATVAAARGNDGQGVAGLCWQCSILPVKVLAGNGSGFLSTVADGVVWAVDHGADVVNLSLGGPTNISALTMALDYAAGHNVIVVGAAGNSGTTNPTYPGAVPTAIAVAGSDPSNGLYPWSQRGADWVDVAAPGCNRATGSGVPADFCGTSSATPFAAGLVGLMRSQRPDLAATAIRAALEATTSPLTTAAASAHGVVDAGAALASISAASLAPADTGPPTLSVDGAPPFLSGAAGTVVHLHDDNGLATVALSAGATALARMDVGGTDATVTLDWDTRALADGPARLTVTVTDIAANSASADLAVRIDNQAPSVATWGPNGAVETGPFGVTVGASDANGVKVVLVAANGQWIGYSIGGGPVQVTVPVTVAGSLRVAALALDQAGRLAISNVVTVTARPAKAPHRTTRRRR